jgi:RimJ/RimL family protein N-acetyltransferase
VSADADRLVGLVTPQTVWPFRTKPPVSASGWVRLLERLEADRAAGLSVTFAVERERNAEITGLIVIRRLELEFRIAEVQFLFGEAFWESGVPLASLTYALDFAFRDIGVHRVEVRTLTGRENVVLRGLGMVQEGLLRDSYPLWGGLASQTIWAMLRAEWLSKQLPSPVRRSFGPARVPDSVDVAETAPELPAWTRALPVMTGRRVTLRELDPADGEMLLRVLDSSDIEACIEPAPTTPDVFQKYIAWTRRQRELGQAVSLAVLVDGRPEPIGLMQVRSKDADFTQAEWGAVLARDYRGTGVFAEAMALVTDFVFRTLGVQRLEARTSGTNFPAVGVLRRTGFVREARLRGSFLQGGEYRDDELWVLTAGIRR